MSLDLMAMIWECTGLDDPTDALVLLRLAWFVIDQKDPERCFASIQQLARVTRHSARQVQRSLTRLEAAGWITAHRAGGRGRALEFRLNRAMLKDRQPRKDDASVALSSENGDAHVAVSSRKDDASVTLLNEKGDIGNEKGCHQGPERVTCEAEKGDARVATKGLKDKSTVEPNSFSASPEKVDPRFSVFKEKYLIWFSRENGFDDAWGPKEDRILLELLAKFATLNFEHWKSILANRAGSVGVPLSESFATWGKDATKWASGPVHRGYVSPNQLAARSTRQLLRHSGNEGPGLVGLMEALHSKRPPTIAGELGNGCPALPAPADAPDGGQTGANGHRTRSAVPAASTAPGAGILAERRTA